jgi:cation diffusion facilitator CzcD-associated flavoprotein CzcO
MAEMAKGDGFGPEVLMRAFEDSDDEKMNEIRARVDSIVEDPATAEALKPWYRQLCKRPCFHDEYLLAFNRPSCHLVDTDGKGVERIDETGVWVGGVHYDLDCLVFASGFEFNKDAAHRNGYETVGRDGETLSKHWAAGMRSLHGVHVHGFPNLFIVGLSQNGSLISNITHNHVESATSIAAVIAHALEQDAIEVEVAEEAEARWVDGLAAGQSTVFGNPDCTPGYYNKEGQPLTDVDRLNMAGYAGGPAAFFTYIDGWRRSGTFEGLEFRTG